MTSITRYALGPLGLVAVLLTSTPVMAEPLVYKPAVSTDLYHPARMGKAPAAPDSRPFAEHFVVFHISDGDAFAQKLVLNNAQNLANYFGPDKVMIEVVAYSAGLRMLFKENTYSKRIQSLSEQGVVFSACAVTMKGMGRDKDSLNKIAHVVPGGVVRLTELGEAGWTYIRP